MRTTSVQHLILGFLAAVVVTVVWGSVVQTQYNLAALTGIGTEIGASTNLGATLTDIFSGFSLTYGGYIVVPALLIAFFSAWLVVQRTGAPLLWFGMAGGLAILIGIPLVNWLSPLALLIGATRDFSCTVLMAMGGLAGGLLFGCITRLRVATPASSARNRKENDTGDVAIER